MDPVRPPTAKSISSASVRSDPSHYLDAPDSRQAQQAGRSASGLAAQQSARSLARSSAQSLHTADPSPSPRRLSKSTIQGSRQSSLDRAEKSGLLAGSSDSLSTDPTKDAYSSSRRSSRPLSSAGDGLISISSSDAASPGEKDKESKGSGSSEAGPNLGAGVRRPPGRRQRPRPPPPPPSGWPRNPEPRSLRDLGSDYTRYYNPFSSRNSSMTNVSAAPKDVAALEVAEQPDSRLSPQAVADPFSDAKRMSNPFSAAPSIHTTSSRRGSFGADEQAQPTSSAHGAVSVGAAAAAAAGIVAVEAAATSTSPKSSHKTPTYPTDPEKADFFQYIDDRLGAPGSDWPLITDSKEDDDDMHMPMWDDDVRLKPTLREHFSRENIRSTAGLVFVALGLLCIFLVLPIISYQGVALIDYPGQTPLDELIPPPPAWAYVSDTVFPLLSNVRTGLIDPDTPSSAMTRTSTKGETMKLVFSDEFNEQNRTFYPGDDPYWFAFNGWYGATLDLEWYDPDAINTGDGTLLIQMDQFENHGLDFRSGMLNSWNQLCFKGGIFEVSVSLPGPAGIHGLWPGIWSMGNLGRPGYLATTEGMWPYTYNECDVGITPNQSSPDGISHLPGQRLPSCTCPGEDHPTPGTGRGAPEIDIAEVSADWSSLNLAVATQSFQVAPFDVWYYPNYDYMQTPNYSFSVVNTYTGGPFQQAVSATTTLNNSWYDGVEYQQYAYEYSPGGNSTSYIAWTIADEEMMSFDARAVGPNGNVGQRLISEEPMSLILNLGISENWVTIDWSALSFPTVLHVDYVRLYQLEGQESVTCDPPGFETTDYIAAHPNAYQNPNFTTWADAGYGRPKNSFMDGC